MEPLAIMVSVMTVLATADAPAKMQEPLVFPQVMTAAACPGIAESAKAQVIAEIWKTHRVRVSVMTKCVGVDIEGARLMRRSLNDLLDQ